MARIRKNTGLWNYLSSLNILETASVDEIKQAKKVYWRMYDTALKRRKRKQKRQFSISFTFDEAQSVIKTAATKGMKVPEYIRLSVKADMESTVVFPYPHLLREAIQLLTWHKSQVKKLSEKDSKNWLGRSNNYDDLERTITVMKNELLALFSNKP